ncbi:MAG: LacI family DNA-binding transcriptional regulator [Eubacteriales bacterium]|nr:LacI family DNA-binding transcriptional regulator [Eubacteriales bacterium]
MAGIKDVAKRAGVGVATVSRMLNDSGYVSADARLKIEMAMKELDYIPNELARNLYHKKSGIIAVLVPYVLNPFFAEFIDGVERELYKAGYKIMLCNTQKDIEAEKEYLDMLNRHIVDGLISGMSSLDETVYSKINKPIVALDRYIGENIPVVAVDHREGGKLAAEALADSGCKRVLHFQSAVQGEALYLERHVEFQRVMEKKGIDTYCYNLDWSRLDIEYYHQVVEEVFEKDIEFDGVFGVDRLAIECMNGLIRRKKRIPQDVKIVSYDGTYITDLVEPKITTVVQPIRGMAQESVRLLCEMINGKKYKNKQVILKTKLRKGGTTLLQDMRERGYGKNKQ